MAAASPNQSPSIISPTKGVINPVTTASSSVVHLYDEPQARSATVQRGGPDSVSPLAFQWSDEFRFADPDEPGRSERFPVDEPAHPAVTAVGVALVVGTPDRGEDAPAPEVPLLDLVWSPSTSSRNRRRSSRSRSFTMSSHRSRGSALGSTPHCSSRSSAISSMTSASTKRSAAAQSGTSPGSSATSSTLSPMRSARSSSVAGPFRKLVLGTARERVLELVVGEVALLFGEVALCHEFEIGVAVVVERESLGDDDPADRLTVRGRREGVTESGRTGAVAAESPSSSRSSGWWSRRR